MRVFSSGEVRPTIYIVGELVRIVIDKGMPNPLGRF